MTPRPDSDATSPGMENPESHALGPVARSAERSERSERTTQSGVQRARPNQGPGRFPAALKRSVQWMLPHDRTLSLRGCTVQSRSLLRRLSPSRLRLYT
ncbi:hypothetical protein MTO96_036772 [Rhipicephalus appendiculatus]